MDTVSLVVANELIEKLLHLDHTLSLLLSSSLPLSLSLSPTMNLIIGFHLWHILQILWWKNDISICYCRFGMMYLICQINFNLEGSDMSGGDRGKKRQNIYLKLVVNCWHRPEWCELQCIWNQSFHFIPIYVECIYNIECLCKRNAYDN